MTAKQMNDDWKNLGLSAGKISETGEIILNENSAQEMRDKGAMIHNKSVAIANQLIPSILGANPTLNMD